MRKRTSLLAVLIVLAVVFSGCGASSKQSALSSIEQGPIISSNNEIITQDEVKTASSSEAVVSMEHEADNAVEIATPTNAIYFRSRSEYERLKNTLDESDEVLLEYLSAKNYVKDGLETREDVAALIAIVDDAPIPIIDELELSTLIVYPDEKRMFIRYKGNNSLYLTFMISTDEADATGTGETSEELSAGYWDELHFVCEDEESFSYTYRAVKEGRFFIIQVHNTDRETADTLLINATF